MKHPFWIVNSALALLVLLAALFMSFTRVSTPEREEIAPAKRVVAPRERTLEINLQKIYENDLFETLQPALPPTELAPRRPRLPDLPRDQIVKIPAPAEPSFLDPLDVTLKGIVVIRPESEQNVAIVSENKTGREMSYHIGDVYEDAQLINILNNKVVFLRSNGQQEVLYLREQDAKLDPSYLTIDGWENVVKQRGANRFMINPSEFAKRVESLAQFIDMLGLTSAYKQGKSVGCRIGLLEEKSLGGQLGLQTGDLILTVNGTPATTTENRLKIYRDVVALQGGDAIAVELTRTNRPFTLEIILQKTVDDDVPPHEVKAPAQKIVARPIAAPKSKENIAKRSQSLAPTVDQIRQRDRQNMLQKGGLP